MTTTYSPMALLIIALAFLLVLVVLLTLASFICYMATGRHLFGRRGKNDPPALFALQEVWRQSYWWLNANWGELTRLLEKGAVRPVDACRTEKTMDVLQWLRTTKNPTLEAFVSLQPQSRHLAARFAAPMEEGSVELTGVEAAGYTLPLLERALTTREAADLQALLQRLDAEHLPPQLSTAALQADVRRRWPARLARLLQGKTRQRAAA